MILPQPGSPPKPQVSTTTTNSEAVHVGKLFAENPERSQVQRRIAGSVAHLADHIEEVPALLVPCLTVSQFPEGSQARVWGFLFPAIWSYMLAARAQGLGTVWTSLHLKYENEVAKLLRLPAEVRQGALIPTAYYTGDGFRPATRQSLDEVLHVDGW